MPGRTLHLSRERFPGRPAFDTAVSRALMEGVACGRLPDTFRLFVPERILAFGRQDAARPAYPAAVGSARTQGFAPVERLAGGRAAVFHEYTLAFAWAVADPDPRASTRARFGELAAVVVDALRSLGVDARVGEVPGEYCPGAHSVNAGGRHKIMGVGQRLMRGAAHVGGVVVVDRPDLVNRVLAPVYRHLGYEWDPEATGAVASEAPADLGTVAQAMVAALAARFEVHEAPLDAWALERAAGLAAEHAPAR